MTKFYICRTCGNQIQIVRASGVPVFCCGKPMEELIPNTVEASGEKHLPVAGVEGDAVEIRVGAVDHPMADVHHIEWVYVETERGGIRHDLKPGEAPHVTVSLGGEKAVAVYAYCNLHGLWKTEL